MPTPASNVQNMSASSFVAFVPYFDDPDYLPVLCPSAIEAHVQKTIPVLTQLIRPGRCALYAARLVNTQALATVRAAGIHVDTTGQKFDNEYVCYEYE